jgi:hypothetical protein
MRREAHRAMFVKTVLFRRFLVKLTVNSVKLVISNRTPTRLSAYRVCLVSFSHPPVLIAVWLVVLVRNPTRLRVDQATFLALAKPIVFSVILVFSITAVGARVSLVWRAYFRFHQANLLVCGVPRVNTAISLRRVSASNVQLAFSPISLVKLNAWAVLPADSKVMIVPPLATFVQQANFRIRRSNPVARIVLVESFPSMKVPPSAINA